MDKKIGITTHLLDQGIQLGFFVAQMLYYKKAFICISCGYRAKVFQGRHRTLYICGQIDTTETPSGHRLVRR